MTAALIAAAAVFLVRSIAPQTLGEQVRRHLVKQLQAHYQDHEVTIRRGRYEPNLGFIFEDILVSDAPQQHGINRWMASESDQGDSLSIDRLIVLADAKPKKLLDQENPFVTRRVIVDGIKINSRLADDGKPTIASLWPPPAMGPCAPRMEIRDASIRLQADQRDPIDFHFSDLVVVAHPDSDAESAGRTRKSIAAKGSCHFAKSISAQAESGPDGWVLKGTIKKTQLNADLLQRLPAGLRRQLSSAAGLQCLCDVTLAAAKRGQSPIDFHVKTNVLDGRLEHRYLPMPLTHLRGLVSARPDGITIQACQASLGDAVVRMSGQAGGLSWPMPLELNVSATSVMLSDQLAAALPTPQRAKWDRVQPQGRVDIVDGKIVHRGGVWSASGSIQCKGVDVRMANFPYPVHQLVGRIEINDGVATCRAMTGRAGGRRLQCGFQFPILPTVKKEKLFVLATDGAIAIDETLISALTPRAMPQSKLESFVRALRPRGAVLLHRATFKTDVSGKKTRSIDMDLMDSHLRYEQFPYPLYNVSGNLRVEDDLLTLSKFHGVNANAGRILCDGSYLMPRVATASTAAADSALHLRFRGAKIPMDDSLRSSLPESAQKTWDAISPSGVLDHLDVIVAQNGAGKPLNLSVSAVESKLEQLSNKVLSVRPGALPYRLDITDGSVRYDGRQVFIDSIKARHDGTRIAADGSCRQDPGGQWRFSLNIHSGSRLDPNPELIAALPNEMRGAMNRLQLRGPVNIRGRTDILLSDQKHPHTSMDWDVVLQLEGNRFGDVGPVHSMRGELSIRGRRNERGLLAGGFLRLDSMHVNDLQLTAIRGPYSVQDDKLRLGREPTAKQDATSQEQSIRGRLFDGMIELKGEVLLSSASFDVGIGLVDAQVPTLLADLGQGRSELTGTFAGNLNLEGTLGTTDLLRGNGAAKVSGANLYQLPLLVQLLNLLRITPTEDVAFTDADVLFSIVEDRINFDDLKLWGDLVSLHGSGTMNWRQELDLTFNTRVSPKTTFSRIMKPLGGQRYTIWDVDVRGPLNDPAVELRPLESVGQTLERIFPAIGPQSKSKNREETAGPSKWFRY